MSSQMLLNLEEETWKGRIPIQFSLSATDILSYASFSAHTYYSFASRYKLVPETNKIVKFPLCFVEVTV